MGGWGKPEGIARSTQIEPSPVMRANVVRWMLVFAVGGVWAAETTPPTKEGAEPPVAPAIVGTGAPRADFASMIHDFGKIQAGAVVRHDFVFTNGGTGTLRISEVRPGCGCTTAGTWDKEVEPGKTGKIPIQFNAGSFSGNVGKSISVTCNDAARSNVLLQLKANIWTPISLTPVSLYFTMTDESVTNETKVVRIVNNLDEALTLSDPVTTNTAFTGVLKTVKQGREFDLHVTPVVPLPVSYAIGSFSIRTSSDKVPTLNVPVSANVQPVISVFPSVLTLSAGPRTVPSRTVVTLRNAGSQALALSDPKIEIPGAKVEVNELQPGRLFRLTLELPPEAAPTPGQGLELSVASTHPKFPRVRVPVRWVAPNLPSPTAAKAAVTNRVPRPAVSIPPPPPAILNR